MAYVKTWHHVDASGRILGKLAGRIATVLMGKHKPTYDPSSKLLFNFQTNLFSALILVFRTADCGDYVVVTNASKVLVTGRKEEQKVYRHHTMYPGGLKEIKYRDMKEKKPDEVSWYLSTRFSS